MASQSGSLTLHPSPAPIGRDALAAAAERRRGTSKLSTKVQQELQLKEKRNTFQRLIDPGIIGPNSREQALKSLRVSLNLMFPEPVGKHEHRIVLHGIDAPQAGPELDQ